MIKLSILIPVYNAEKYIGALLDVILKQMDEQTEVVLLNDGSRDSSAAICSEYEAKYPKQIRLISRENKGAVRTRRELFQASAGEWIWIIDSDDMLTDHSVEVIMREISSNEQCDMILFDHYQGKEAGGTIVHQLPFEGDICFEGADKNEIYKLIINGTNINPLWNKVFKRTCVDFDTDYSEYEDIKKANDCFQMIPIITNATIIKYLRTPLYIYNINNQESLSHAFSEATYTSLVKVWTRRKEYIIKWDMWDVLRDDYYAHASSIALNLLCKYARYDKTKKEYFAFFDRVLTDGVFLEAIRNCDYKKLNLRNRVYFSAVRRGNKELSYALFRIQK